ncbi:MAG: carboxypeptidase-like regulatory domain-containing protein, partial [Holophaga sp.]|nr:carboxypeptidase-like regulatory domain-containing protein [Holophaga sp.]
MSVFQRVPCLLGLAGLPALLTAQSTGLTTSDLSVRVRSEGSQPIPGARLKLRQEGAGISRTYTGGADGHCLVRVLTAGSYVLRVEAPGFQAREFRNVTLRVGSTHSLEATLVPEARATVEVIGDASSLELQRTQPAAILETAELLNLPIARRNFADLSLATPFATTARTPINAGAPDSGLSFGGAGARQNSFLIDGLDHND